MFNRDRWKEILEVLSSNVFRTLATSFGVGWGIFILIILLAAGKGLENGIRADFGDIATNTMFMWSRNTTMPYKGLPKGRRFSFKLEDVQAIKDNVPDLRFISPRNQLGGFRGANNVVRGLRTGAFNVYGDYPEIIKQEPMTITSGRFVNHNDIQDKRKIAVIGDGVRNELYDQGETVIGTYIKIQGVNFMVVGTYQKKDDGGGEEGQKEIYVPFTAFSQAFNTSNDVGWMAITANDGSSISDLKEKIVGVVKEKRKIHPDDKRAVGYFDLYEQFNRVESLFGALRWVAYFVGVLVLLSGIIGVSNIMLIVIKERTKEIGIRRALGEAPWSIKKQILMESIFLTIISGMIGIVFGAAFIYGVNAVLDSVGPVDMFINPSVSLAVVVSALIILVFSGLLAGFIPAQSAIKIRPIEALRTE
ncbi:MULTISPECIES: ABC transporter permease [Maribacter]|uniref:ABC transport system permease protein n=1 Tax=Maribacter dokdonensis TaxID=320912 RepID=A0ABY0US63_9FLAO|nr:MULTISPECIES: ABC transporter permease [Maribacter]KSA15045.1 ABC exporter, permease component [Maribacter dokdonensis DSW-8]MBU2900162.1 ABC transporter permease [Maribacter dokdonensis]SDT10621.1 putative ABC transport system permease protein [Maribacter dokdonensis]HAF78776.1 ABC transporter permease [Maribacter sp.]|tara:strand:+ start:115301 stop:116557 length:1257 start_codon:yes stop_codon:yes gene_type:complete